MNNLNNENLRYLPNAGPAAGFHHSPQARRFKDDIEEIEHAEHFLDALERINADQMELDRLSDRAEFNRNLGRMLLAGAFCVAVLVGADFAWSFDTF